MNKLSMGLHRSDHHRRDGFHYSAHVLGVYQRTVEHRIWKKRLFSKSPCSGRQVRSVHTTGADCDQPQINPFRQDFSTELREPSY